MPTAIRYSLILVVVLAACSSTTEDTTPDPTPGSVVTASATETVTATESVTRRPPTAPASPSESEASASPPFEANTETDTQTPQGSAALVDVQVGGGDGFDEIAFVLGSDAAVGWQVGYEDDPRQDGSGEPVEVDGDAVLAVRIAGILAPFDEPSTREKADPDVSGTTAMVDAVDDSWFEGQWTFFVGLDQRRPFRMAQEGDRLLLQVDTTASG